MHARHKSKTPTQSGTNDGLEVVPRPSASNLRGARGGRRPRGWMGGMRVVEEVVRAPAGMAVRMVLPEGVPYDRIRWGIYAAARLRGMHVSIVRLDGFVHVWRWGGRSPAESSGTPGLRSFWS